MSSLWQRLRRALGSGPASDRQSGARAPLPPAAGDLGEGGRDSRTTAPSRWAGRAASPSVARGAPAADLPAAGEEEAQQIYTYVRRIGPLDERPERCAPEILAALRRLWQAGREAQAVSLGGALASALPHDAAVQLGVAELLCMQRDYGSAEPLLQRALAAAEHASRLRARFLLHEVALAADQAELALTHLTHLLAEDFAYPGARARLAAVQARCRPLAGEAGLDAAPTAALPAVPAGPDGGLAVPAAPTLLGLPSGGTARYQLLRELGCGSAGTVYLARDTELQCELALKVFHPRRRDGGGDEALLRALHEARLLAAVRHPGVIALYDLAGELPGESDGPGSGPPRLAMELCRGGSLRARLRQGPLPVAAALQRTAELLETLAAVHGSGIAHGDLKPENLLFRGPEMHRGDLSPAEAQLGDLVLSDFGLARLGEPAEPTGFLGTPGYAAPEQLGGAPATAASDVYAVAVVLLEMLLGEPPLRRADALSGSPPQVPAARWEALASAGAPAGLADFVTGLLAGEPAARPTAAAALAQLQRLRAGGDV